MDVSSSRPVVGVNTEGIQKYVLSDVSLCTFTFSDGATSQVSPQGKEIVVVKLIPYSSKNEVFQDLVLQHYLHAKTVKELAEECGYDCLKTFARHFKKCFNETPYRWMLDRKMEDVRNTVLNSTMPISQISTIFDFKNVSHLVNAYSNRFGISPSKNRSLHTKVG